MKIALYQTAPGEIYGQRYGIPRVGLPSTSVSLFPATVEGLDAAIKEATRSDAQIVKIEKDYTKAEYLLREVRRLIKSGKGTKLFMPALGVERIVKEN